VYDPQRSDPPQHRGRTTSLGPAEAPAHPHLSRTSPRTPGARCAHPLHRRTNPASRVAFPPYGGMLEVHNGTGPTSCPPARSEAATVTRHEHTSPNPTGELDEP
jgi:hypothetical protein